MKKKPLLFGDTEWGCWLRWLPFFVVGTLVAFFLVRYFAGMIF